MLAIFNDGKRARHESVKITVAGLVLAVLLVEVGTRRMTGAADRAGDR